MNIIYDVFTLNRFNLNVKLKVYYGKKIIFLSVEFNNILQIRQIHSTFFPFWKTTISISLEV